MTEGRNAAKAFKTNFFFGNVYLILVYEWTGFTNGPKQSTDISFAEIVSADSMHSKQVVYINLYGAGSLATANPVR